MKNSTPPTIKPISAAARRPAPRAAKPRPTADKDEITNSRATAVRVPGGADPMIPMRSATVPPHVTAGKTNAQARLANPKRLLRASRLSPRPGLEPPGCSEPELSSLSGRPIAHRVLPTILWTALCGQVGQREHVNFGPSPPTLLRRPDFTSGSGVCARLLTRFRRPTGGDAVCWAFRKPVMFRRSLLGTLTPSATRPRLWPST